MNKSNNVERNNTNLIILGQRSLSQPPTSEDSEASTHSQHKNWTNPNKKSSSTNVDDKDNSSKSSISSVNYDDPNVEVENGDEYAREMFGESEDNDSSVDNNSSSTCDCNLCEDAYESSKAKSSKLSTDNTDNSNDNKEHADVSNE